MESQDFNISGKQYSPVELSGRKYQQLMEKFTADHGEDWQKKGGISLTAELIAACMKDDEGKFPTVDDIMDLPIRRINALGAHVMALNGMTEAAQQVQEKN